MARARFSPDDRWIRFDIYHSHSARQSLLNANIIPQELHVAPGRLLFHLGEITGNIWMVEWKTR